MITSFPGSPLILNHHQVEISHNPSGKGDVAIELCVHRNRIGPPQCTTKERTRLTPGCGHHPAIRTQGMDCKGIPGALLPNEVVARRT